MTITCNCNIKIKKKLILIKFQWLILDFIQSNKSILDPFANSLKFTQFEKYICLYSHIQNLETL